MENPFRISKMCPNKIQIEILCMKNVAREIVSIILCQRSVITTFILRVNDFDLLRSQQQRKKKLGNHKPWHY